MNDKNTSVDDFDDEEHDKLAEELRTVMAAMSERHKVGVLTIASVMMQTCLFYLGLLDRQLGYDFIKHMAEIVNPETDSDEAVTEISDKMRIIFENLSDAEKARREEQLSKEVQPVVEELLDKIKNKVANS